MVKMKLSTLILGVALAGVVQSTPNQSEDSSPEEQTKQPIATPENEVGVRRSDVPEVVLQLKYNRGELNRIYLTQFRKDKKAWLPSVSSRSNLCADLCHAGLGGEACGSSCPQLIPVGLKSALQDANETSVLYGHPRYSVCPALCDNKLGLPLCSCEKKDTEHAVDWSAVCAAFCYDGYALNGCPTCEAETTEASPHFQSGRVLTTYEGWSAWCDVQCRQGQGGAACNCDRAPFQ